MIFFIAPLPPPVHGFSNISERMLRKLSAGADVRVYDRAIRGDKGFLRTAVQQFLLNPVRFFASALGNRGAVMYLALSGGRGQLVDAVYCLIARLCGLRVVIHHHSFAYLRPARGSTRWLLARMRSATHIALANIMREELVSKLGVDRGRIRVISNAAFQTPTARETAPPDHAGPIRVGFLSNITFEKGFQDFFRVLEQAQQRGLPINGTIAGPVAPEAKSAFDLLIRETNNTKALGPIYGDAKSQFYDSIDVFLYPTRYHNEAEPLVLHEALAKGVYVVANDRGCIREMLENNAGVVTTEESFVDLSLSTISSLAADPKKLIELQRACTAQEQRLHDQGQEQLTGLLQQMLGTGTGG